MKAGTDERDGRQVALKILNKPALTTSVKKQVEREITSMTKVQHPNVLKLIEVLIDVPNPSSASREDVIIMVLELATSGELFEYLSFTGNFDDPLARTYFQQMVDGLVACHSNGIAHRDLKPENLLLDSQFSLKVADFGLASVVDESIAAMKRVNFTQCGSEQYMAPEVLNSSSGYNAFACDVWSVYPVRSLNFSSDCSGLLVLSYSSSLLDSRHSKSH